ncbi:carotenoid oxygenase family protein [Rhizobium pusense]|uniref:carotenoid oxygenase family protein n=1 Tax=Agrobacterium pusense TaxID=648995 RepID=UPI001FCD8FB8|nr:carotenoid oxygenase family protein [Agrobacterium pusense]MCJ2877387.1 carotenoid oxygenase family protein [Agrobacterium pusense]
MWGTSNPFLNGFFEPLYNEYSHHDLRVEGKIPLELNGALYRNTTNQHFRPLNPDQTHWFEGDAMVHAFHLRDGKATYRNRWVIDDGAKVERELGRTLYNGVMSRSGIVQGPLPPGAPLIKVPSNINVIALGGKVLALNENSGRYWEISPDELDTLGPFDFDGVFADIGEDGMLTAHPHTDMATGEMLFTNINAEACYMDCFTTDAGGTVQVRHRVQLDAPSWIHDFAITANYMVFFLGSLNCRARDPERVPLGKGMTFHDPDLWSRILLVHRKTRETVRITEQDLYMVTHFLNAYEENGMIIVDACLSDMEPRPSSLVVPDFFPFALPNKGPSPFSGPRLHRWTIDPVKAISKHNRLGDFEGEFVRTSDLVFGRKHRYGYMAGMYSQKTERPGFNCLIKIDYYQEGRYEYQYLGTDTDYAPGEPVFVPRPGGVDEDDGWIMAIWGDARNNTSELVILNAKNFGGEPAARVKLDHRVTNGFHGNWISEEDLRAGRLARNGFSDH